MKTTIIKQTLTSRVAIKYNHLQMEETGKVYTDNRYDEGLFFPLYEIKKMLIEGSYTNIVTVTVGGANGCYGPNVQPSPKGIKRLTSLINGTKYRIVQQKGQEITLEGLN